MTATSLTADDPGPTTKLDQHARSGAWLDLRVGDERMDDPTNGAGWGAERTIRAEAIAELLTRGDHGSRRAVRLRGARIAGTLSLEGVQIDRPFALIECHFDEPIAMK